MKYAVMFNLQTKDNKGLDNLFSKIEEKLKEKARWENARSPNAHAKGRDEDGRPVHRGLQRFYRQEDAREVFEHIKELADKIPWVKGSVHIHRCIGHDGEESGQCEILEEFRR